MNRKTSTDSEATGARSDSSDRGAAHRAILQTYFFEWIDRGIGADETPLFTRTHEGKPLSDVIARRFQLTQDEAKARHRSRAAGGGIVKRDIHEARPHRQSLSL